MYHINSGIALLLLSECSVKPAPRRPHGDRSSHLFLPAVPLPKMPTQLENAMDTLIKIFHHYSGKEGDKYKLNKGELKQLLTSELTDFLSCQKDLQLVDKIMKDLDTNKDNEVDFNEFVILVAALTVACNDFFEEQLKQKEIGNDE
ncbi:protein S100-Z isoform X1 [Emydura macquarii macquarii]|uniref:protein S100-Z isoform X1 n=2 Tax=Emydura macquarii macquarii TaxID=1129001 RepID=UPI00352B6790